MNAKVVRKNHSRNYANCFYHPNYKYLLQYSWHRDQSYNSTYNCLKKRIEVSQHNNATPLVCHVTGPSDDIRHTVVVIRIYLMVLALSQLSDGNRITNEIRAQARSKHFTYFTLGTRRSGRIAGQQTFAHSRYRGAWAAVILRTGYMELCGRTGGLNVF